MRLAFHIDNPAVGAFVGGVMSQIETFMVFALGSALTFVLVLLFGRFFWGLAVSAAAKRKARMAPIEVLDAQAERDKLRAEHALMARKLDLRLEDIKMRMAEQMAEVSRNRNRVQGLVEEIERRDEILRQKDKDNANLAAQLDVHRAELSAAHKTIEGLNSDARRHETEMTRLQQAFRQMSVTMRDKQQAWHTISGDLRTVSALPTPPTPESTESVLRKRVAEISAISSDMKREHTQQQVFVDPLLKDNIVPQHTAALSSKLDEAQRLSDDMERELKSLDVLLGLGSDPAPQPERRKRARVGSNVISLAQRIRALQRGMGD
jgi:chromosome segregation ATPase